VERAGEAEHERVRGGTAQPPEAAAKADQQSIAERVGRHRVEQQPSRHQIARDLAEQGVVGRRDRVQHRVRDDDVERSPREGQIVGRRERDAIPGGVSSSRRFGDGDAGGRQVDAGHGRPRQRRGQRQRVEAGATAQVEHAQTPGGVDVVQQRADDPGATLGRHRERATGEDLRIAQRHAG